MHINPDNDDRVTLTLHEIRTLVVIAEGPTTAYDIAKINELSLGTVAPLLKRLKRAYLIYQLDPLHPLLNPGQPNKLYRLTPAGKFVLERQLESLKSLIKLGEERLRREPPPSTGSRARARYQTR